MPGVIAKWAQTLDGAIASRTGDSKWISNRQSRRDVHRLRGVCDGVLTGIGTVLADDPRFTVRGVPTRRLPSVIVIDPEGRLDNSFQLGRRGSVASVGSSHKHVLEHDAQRFEETMPAFWHAKLEAEGQIDLAWLLRTLHTTHGMSTLLIEAGGGVISDLWSRRLIDEIRVYVAPRVIGDPGAMRAIRLGVQERMPQEDGAWTLLSTKRFKDDVRLTYVNSAALNACADGGMAE